jgi:excinuclease UvrABC ATPase subunit
MTPALLASTFLLIVTLSYASLCVASPFGNCRKCHGMGHAIKTDRKGRTKRGKDCRRCKATGKRIRVGRHLYNVAARLHRDGTR